MSQPSKNQVNDLAKKFSSLHQSGSPILLSNVWDAASAALIANQPHTKAIATASFAIAATQGIDDNDMQLEHNIAGIKNVIAGLKKVGKWQQLPLTADLQDGYDDPAQTALLMSELGVVGCNIEDVNNKTGQLREVEDAVARIKLFKQRMTDAGIPDFVVNARTDVLGYGGNISDVVERGTRYLEAGARTVFVWGVQKWDIKEDEVKQMVEAFGGKLAVQPGSIGVERLKELGVARISVGPALWRKSMSVLVDEAVKLKTLS